MVRKVMSFMMLLVLTPLSIYAQGAGKDSAIDYKAEGKEKLVLRDYENALINFDKAIEQNPNDAEAYCFMGLAKMMGGRGYKLVRRAGGAYDDWFIKDRSNKKTDFKKAIGLTDEAILKNPKDEKAYLYRAVSKIWLYDDITGDLDKIIKLGNGVDVDLPTLKAIKVGTIADLDKVIELNPEDSEAYYYKTMFTSVYGLDGAIEYASKAIALNPKYAEAYKRRAELKDISKVRDLKGAIQDYTKYIELIPKDWLAYEERARIKEELKDYEGAIADLRKAKELSPDEIVSYSVPEAPPTGLTRHKDYENRIADLEAKIVGKGNKK